MERRPWVASSLALVFLTAGCSALPRVRYQAVTGPDEAGTIKFVLAHSLITLNVKRSLEEGQQLVAMALPSDLPVREVQRVYSIVPVSQTGVKTHLNVTYIPNSRVLSSLGSEIEDNRIKTIGQVAGIVISGAEIVGAFERLRPGDLPASLPAVIDPKADPKEAGGKAPWRPLPANAGWHYQLELGPVPPDSVATETFFGSGPRETSVLPFSACRDAVLRVLKDKEGAPEGDGERNARTGEAWLFGLKIADPDYVQTVQLPQKGKIEMHTSCGVNVTSEKTDTASTWAVIGEAMKQASAIVKAYGAIDSAGQKKQ